MFHRKGSGLYVSSLLQEHSWIEHGFASRDVDGWPDDYSRVKQIHSAIIRFRDGDTPAPDEEGDAVATRVSGRWVGIRTADCVPLLLADTANRAVAAVHAGWRGTLANITGTAIDQMREVYGTQSENVLVAIGPCIAECCFEVGPEVAEQFEPLLKFETLPSHIDLVEANLRQLLAAGLSAEHVDVADLCTRCEADQFHSWRRDREASGRMVSAIRVSERS